MLNKMAVSYKNKTPLKFQQGVTLASSPSRNIIKKGNSIAASAAKLKPMTSLGLRKSSVYEEAMQASKLKSKRTRSRIKSGILPEKAEMIQAEN